MTYEMETDTVVLITQRAILVAGVDEAGRGPLAGPVVAAAVILDSTRPIKGLADSKTLSAAQRETLAVQIRLYASAWAVGEASVEEIDRLNILQATLLAMQRAVVSLSLVPTLALVDGNQAPRLSCAVRTVVRGDASEPAISAASIRRSRGTSSRRRTGRRCSYHPRCQAPIREESYDGRRPADRTRGRPVRQDAPRNPH